MDWLAEGLMVTILGLATVFTVLIFISLILSVFGVVSKKTTKEKTALKPAVDTKPVNVVKKTGEKNVNDDLELIAVITAAIAASECANGNNIGPDKLVVRSLRRVNTWNKETMHEQQSTLF